MTDATWFDATDAPREATGPERPKPRAPLFIGDVALRTPSGTMLLDVLKPDGD